MNLWLLDASVLLAGEDVDDTHHDSARRLLSGSDPLTTLDLAFYEVANVAVRAWHDLSAAQRMEERLEAIVEDGGLIRASMSLLADASSLADQHGISVYDAAYVAAAGRAGARLVSCDVQDLVSRQLACLPSDALTHHQD